MTVDLPGDAGESTEEWRRRQKRSLEIPGLDIEAQRTMVLPDDLKLATTQAELHSGRDVLTTGASRKALNASFLSGMFTSDSWVLLPRFPHFPSFF